jgi:hypothetical protein
VERAKPLVYIVKLDHGKKFNFHDLRVRVWVFFEAVYD